MRNQLAFILYLIILPSTSSHQNPPPSFLTNLNLASQHIHILPKLQNLFSNDAFAISKLPYRLESRLHVMEIFSCFESSVVVMSILIFLSVDSAKWL